MTSFPSVVSDHDGCGCPICLVICSNVLTANNYWLHRVTLTSWWRSIPALNSGDSTSISPVAVQFHPSRGVAVQSSSTLFRLLAGPFCRSWRPNRHKTRRIFKLSRSRTRWKEQRSQELFQSHALVWLVSYTGISSGGHTSCVHD